MGFKLIDDITMADIAFRLNGQDINELFFSGALALMSVMIDNPESISRDIKKNISLKDPNLDNLLFNFLQEFIFYKDAESLLLLPKNLKINRIGDDHKCDAELLGEIIDHEKHQLNVDVKAVTMHNFELKKETDHWIATVVLDV